MTSHLSLDRVCVFLLRLGYVWNWTKRFDVRNIFARICTPLLLFMNLNQHTKTPWTLAMSHHTQSVRAIAHTNSAPQGIFANINKHSSQINRICLITVWKSRKAHLKNLVNQKGISLAQICKKSRRSPNYQCRQTCNNFVCFAVCYTQPHHLPCSAKKDDFCRLSQRRQDTAKMFNYRCAQMKRFAVFTHTLISFYSLPERSMLTALWNRIQRKARREKRNLLLSSLLVRLFLSENLFQSLLLSW